MEERRAVRKGRYHEIASWEQQYKKKLVLPEEAAQQIKNGDTVALTGGASMPRRFEAAMAKTVLEKDIHIEVMANTFAGEVEFIKPDYKDNILINSVFFTGEKTAYGQGNLTYLPNHLSWTGKIIESRRPRVISITCSRPDENGWMSRSLWGIHVSRDAFESPSCEVLIATVNEKLPYVLSEGDRHMMIHVSEVDYIIEEDNDVSEIKTKKSTRTEINIAGYIAELIEDGACLQLGQGGLADAVGENLIHSEKKHLGFHSELLTNSCVKLLKAGVIDNSQKKLCPGKLVGSIVSGDRELWEFLDHNPQAYIFELDWVNDIKNISANDNVVSVNSAMEIDLTGQVCSESIGYRQFAGTGGQFEWVMGAQMSKGGKSIIAINSSYTDKQGEMKSKIKPILTPGAVVTTLRNNVQYVVTEYGVADLKYKTVRERTKSLIGIAHPAFREELSFEAKKMLYIL